MGCLSSSAAGGSDDSGGRYAPNEAEPATAKAQPSDSAPSKAPADKAQAHPEGNEDPLLSAAGSPAERQPGRTDHGRAVPVERVGLFRDRDGDEAHEFWEEDPGSGALRPVAAADLRHVEAQQRR
eukprot:CAMPEP_0171202192 /NCGR_PEP_ID=MMETSP0790-20130122/24875_1 /TAXON_ID=2925 /ORGANISM="Alexandrium catenella, Strain OF101" /LENGTH=124 /DNA_ID=CAMNT_0011667607 /DNA_START=48 /DNA_END=422 /DNA_ORIENTATION=+